MPSTITSPDLTDFAVRFDRAEMEHLSRVLDDSVRRFNGSPRPDFAEHAARSREIRDTLDAMLRAGMD
jgi:hypothetical protein